MKNIILKITALVIVAGVMVRCSDSGVTSSTSATGSSSSSLLDVAQTSGQLASGSTFTISESSTDSTSTKPGHHGFGKHKGKPVLLDGIGLLAPTDEILALIDAESASDFRGLRISKNGGATITNYDADGNVVTLSTPSSDGPQGCSFSGHQFPVYDSLLSTIVKTVIDFGSGVTYKHDTISITRSGKITIVRSGSGSTKSEITTFENYVVNGITIEGTKTRISTFDSATGVGKSKTTVSDGKITLTDGTVTTWSSDKTRTSTITLDSLTNKPVSGTIVTDANTSVVTAGGTVIYSNSTTTPLTENIACGRERHGPVSGTLETHYRDNAITVDFGDGSCTSRTITITINGVTTTKTIGG